MSLKLLWRLQEIDLAVKDLEDEVENTSLHREAREAAERLDELGVALEKLAQVLGEQRKKLRRGELDLESITAEHGELYRKLYSGEVKNIKELEQMEIKLRSVKQKQLGVEEVLLGMMESMEGQEQQLSDLTAQRDEASAELQRRRQRLEEELARLEGELERLGKQRADLAARIEPQYLERYRELAGRYQGRGLAAVIDDICQGCSVFISSAQRGFLYDPRAMVYCESCGRLLVRFTREEMFAEQGEREKVE